MKFLVDENSPKTIVEMLRNWGYDLLWIREYHRGMTDDEIIHLSISQKLVILTFDKDFGELIYRAKIKNVPGVILVRISDNRACIEILSRFLNDYGNALEGNFFVLTDKKIRRRNL